jgi:hypothetical protein
MEEMIGGVLDGHMLPECVIPQPGDRPTVIVLHHELCSAEQCDFQFYRFIDGRWVHMPDLTPHREREL